MALVGGIYYVAVSCPTKPLVLTLVRPQRAAFDVLKISVSHSAKYLLFLILAALSSPFSAGAQSVDSDDVGGFCPLDRVQSFAWMETLAESQEMASTPIWKSELGPLLGQRITTAPANVFLHDPDDGQTILVQIQGLLDDGSRLEGEYVRVGSEELEGPTESAPGDGADYRFEPDLNLAKECITDLSKCSRFDAVNLYYHIDTFVREFWIDPMGVDIDFQADAKVHISGDGGFADYPNRIVKLGVGDIFMKNSALSDDIIYHEYSHLAISNLGFEIGTGTPVETRAMSEGYADYFTATYTDDPRIGEWVVTCPDRQHCIGPENSAEFRTIDLHTEEWLWNWGSPSDTLKYGVCTRYHEGDQKCKISYNNFADPYVWGMIWGAALWDLRELLGATIVDDLVVAAIRIHSGDASFVNGLDDLVQVALQRHGMGVAQTVIQVFEGRQIATTIVDAVEEGDLESGFRLQVWPVPAANSLTLRIQTPPGKSVRWAIFDLTGRRVHPGELISMTAGTQEVFVPLSHLSSGLYVLRLESESVILNRQIIVVR